MDTNTPEQTIGKLTESEERIWNLVVEIGAVIREPIVQSRRLKLENDIKRAEAEGNKRLLDLLYRQRDRSSGNSMKVIPVNPKRWIVLRFLGHSFADSCAMANATWADIQDAKAKSEEFRCAFAAYEENSRQLMKAKAMSIVEQSQNDGAKVSLAQTQVAIKILSSLDRSNFSEYAQKLKELNGDADRDQSRLGNGGFVINLIGDAAKVAEAVPAKAPKKAIVYTDV